MGQREKIELNVAIEQLINHWQSKNITICTRDENYVRRVLKSRKMTLPDDFIIFYSRVNGMEKLYPNYTDSEGFLFYPIEFIEFADKFFASTLGENEVAYIFADYLQKSWWYAVKFSTIKNSYEIGIMPNLDKFIMISNSLAKFISLYINDADELYQV